MYLRSVTVLVPVYFEEWGAGIPSAIIALDISLNPHRFLILAFVIDLYNLHHRFLSSSPIPLQ
jgi:energy-coupling factor transporter ATP-binding protein EcfA2